MRRLFIAFLVVAVGTIIVSFSLKQANMTMNNGQFDSKNVLGQKLKSCCMEPRTGWFRDGYCNTNFQDRGVHVVCAEMTDEFLNFSASCGNDLVTPYPEFNFPGLKAGDKWCLCVARWKEAMEKGVAPPVVLESTHEKALEVVTLEQLQQHALK